MGPVEKLLRDSLATYKIKGGAVGKEWVGKRCCALGAIPVPDMDALDRRRAYYGAMERLDEAAVMMDPGCSFDLRSLGTEVAAARFNDRYVPTHGALPVRNLYRRAIRLAMERGE